MFDMNWAVDLLIQEYLKPSADPDVSRIRILETLLNQYPLFPEWDVETIQRARDLGVII